MLSSSDENIKVKARQASPLKSVKLALDDVSACRRRLEKLESDLIHASDRYDSCFA